jgi:hypothetical protein
MNWVVKTILWNVALIFAVFVLTVAVSVAVGVLLGTERWGRVGEVTGEVCASLWLFGTIGLWVWAIHRRPQAHSAPPDDYSDDYPDEREHRRRRLRDRDDY